MAFVFPRLPCVFCCTFFFSSRSVFIVMSPPCSYEPMDAASLTVNGACMEIDKTIDGCATHCCSSTTCFASAVTLNVVGFWNTIGR